MSINGGEYLRTNVFDGAGPVALPTRNQNIIPKFEKRYIQNEARSREEGRPVFDEREVISFIIGGDSKSAPEQRVTDEIRQRFPEEYAAFKRGEEIAQSGTPLEMWPWLNTAQVKHLKYLNVFSVEQLAEGGEKLAGSLGMGGRTLVSQAQAWLETAKNGAVPTRLVEENESLKAEVERLRNQIDEIGAQSAKLEKRVETYQTRADQGSIIEDDAVDFEMSNPAILGSIRGTEIPRNWRDLSWQEQRSIASKISMAAIVNKADAVEALEEAERTLKQ